MLRRNFTKLLSSLPLLTLPQIKTSLSSKEKECIDSIYNDLCYLFNKTDGSIYEPYFASIDPQLETMNIIEYYGWLRCGNEYLATSFVFPNRVEPKNKKEFCHIIAKEVNNRLMNKFEDRWRVYKLNHSI